MTIRSQREIDLGRIALLEAHQVGRRDAIKKIEGLIEDKQIEIDNLRARLDEPVARGLTAI